MPPLFGGADEPILQFAGVSSANRQLRAVDDDDISVVREAKLTYKSDLDQVRTVDTDETRLGPAFRQRRQRHAYQVRAARGVQPRVVTPASSTGIETSSPPAVDGAIGSTRRATTRRTDSASRSARIIFTAGPKLVALMTTSNTLPPKTSVCRTTW